MWSVARKIWLLLFQIRKYNIPFCVSLGVSSLWCKFEKIFWATKFSSFRRKDSKKRNFILIWSLARKIWRLLFQIRKYKTPGCFSLGVASLWCKIHLCLSHCVLLFENYNNDSIIDLKLGYSIHFVRDSLKLCQITNSYCIVLELQTNSQYLLIIKWWTIQGTN